jgi:hypothetical protein
MLLKEETIFNCGSKLIIRKTKEITPKKIWLRLLAAPHAT